MKRLLVTGAAGFLGSHLVEACLQAGHSVRCLVRYNSRGSWGWLEDFPNKKSLEVRAGDIRDFDSVRAHMDGCDGVLHLAALIGIPYSYESPLAYIRTNVEGTYNVLQSARTLGVKDVIVTSTSETYGTAQRVPIDEDHPLVGQSPYSASKIAADQLAISFHRSFGLPVKIVRPFNVYGPRQSARAIIPTVITQILAGKKQLKLGNLTPTRDLTFVKDTARAFLAVLDEPSFAGQVVNVGNGKEISVGDLVQRIASVMSAKVEIIAEEQRVRPAASEVERLLCDNTRILKTSWRPEYDLERGLQETVHFLQANQHLYKPESYNV